MKPSMNRPVFACLTLALLLLASCRASVYRPKMPISTKEYRQTILNDLTQKNLVTAWQSLPEDTDTQRRSKVDRRNQILREYIWLIDQNYDTFEARYYGEEAAVNWAGDLVNLGLTGVASVTGTAQLKSVLSLIATGTTGIKTSYEKNFFDQQTRAAIVQKMRALRATELAILNDDKHMKAGLEYSLADGINDATYYYDQGTVIAALQSISENAGVQTRLATEKRAQSEQIQQRY